MITRIRRRLHSRLSLPIAAGGQEEHYGVRAGPIPTNYCPWQSSEAKFDGFLPRRGQILCICGRVGLWKTSGVRTAHCLESSWRWVKLPSRIDLLSNSSSEPTHLTRY